MSFAIDAVVLRVVQVPLVEPFRTSFGTIQERSQIIVEIQGAGISGWGESAVLPFPFYNHETLHTALHILKDFAIPAFFRDQPHTPQALHETLDHIIGNRVGRAGLEMAYWDWTAKTRNEPLFKMLGGVRREVPVGVSLPLYKDPGVLHERIAQHLERGYKRIKVKIAPQEDLTLVRGIFDKFGAIPLMVDGNSAFTLADMPLFRALNELPLMMIEQPLRNDDLVDHAKLQKVLKIPICLDESVEHAHHAAAAVELGSCKIINIKPGRVGGLTEALRVHDIAAANNIGVWCGGMLETGIGRAANIALATLPNFIYPGDISESARYFREDIIEPAVELSSPGCVAVRDEPGIGFMVREDRLAAWTTNIERFASHRQA